MLKSFGKWVVRKLMRESGGSQTLALDKIEKMTCEDFYKLIHEYRK